MGTSAISPNLSAPGLPSSSGGQGGGKLEQLKQELNRLETEKRKAVQSGDSEKIEELEKKIQDIKEQIERLKRQEDEEPQREQPQQKPASESYMDVYA